MTVFKGRYEHGEIQRELKAEFDWVKRVKELLTERAAKANEISQFRLNCFIDWYLKWLPADEKPGDAA